MFFLYLQEMMKRGIPISPLMRLQFAMWKNDIKRGERVLLGDVKENLVYELGYDEADDRLFIKDIHPLEEFIRPA